MMDFHEKLFFIIADLHHNDHYVNVRCFVIGAGSNGT